MQLGEGGLAVYTARLIPTVRSVVSKVQPPFCQIWMQFGGAGFKTGVAERALTVTTTTDNKDFVWIYCDPKSTG
jgi:hypothetical protein